MRRAARIDENQPAIAEGLLYLGASVQTLAPVGLGCPDLLVGWKGKNFLLEIKNPDKPKADQQLTRDQKKWHKCWHGKVAVVRTLEEAIRVVNCNGCGCE